MMKQEHNNYIIYKAENTSTGEVYIGATSLTIEVRKKDHIKKALNGEETKFYEAISTYGSDTFKWEQVDTASSVDELAQKEKEYILEFNSKKDGYNSDEGGGIKKSVYKYDLENGNLIETYKCLEKAALSINESKQGISSACLSVNNTYKGYYWSYILKEPFEPQKDTRKKEVIQYTLDGLVVSEFKSVAEASKETEINKNCISKVCRGERKSAGNYVWCYS